MQKPSPYRIIIVCFNLAIVSLSTGCQAAAAGEGEGRT